MQEAAINKILKLAEGYMVHEVQGILEAMAAKAKEGDVAAAKLILDRVLPAKRSVDSLPAGMEIIINVGGYEEKPNGNQIIEATRSEQVLPDGTDAPEETGTTWEAAGQSH